MLETAAAIAVIKPLVETVFTGIVGNAAHGLFKKLWDLPSKEVNEFERALLISAINAAAECYDKALRAADGELTKDERKRIGRAASDYRKSSKGIAKGAPIELLDRITIPAKAAPGDETGVGQFGALADLACRDMPEVVHRTFADHFGPALRMNFRRQLRDNDRVFKLLTVDALQDIAARLGAWRDLDEEQHGDVVERLARMEQGIQGILDRSVDPTHGTLSDPLGLDLLKNYPEPQPRWVGRVAELAALHTAWAASETRVCAVVGFGGEGKTALARRVTETLRRLSDDPRRPVVIWWSFYFNRAADSFFHEVLRHFGIPLQEDGHALSGEQCAAKLTQFLRNGADDRPVLLVLDGLETMQDQTAGREGVVTDLGLRSLLRGVLNDAAPDTPQSGMILITTREPVRDLKREDDPRFADLSLDQLSNPDGVALLTGRYGLRIDEEEAEAFVKEVRGHALTLTLTGGLLSDAGATNATLKDLRDFIAGEEARVKDGDLTTRGEGRKRPHRLPGYVLRHCGGNLKPEERQFMRLLSCCVRPATRLDIEDVFLHALTPAGGTEAVNDRFAGGKYTEVRDRVLRRLRNVRLIEGDEDTGFDMHPLVRRHFYNEEKGRGALTDAHRKAVHARFYDVLVERPEKKYPDTLEEMQPLIDAVLHGCRAGGKRVDSAQREIYYTRIGRKDDRERTANYLNANLGASETNLELLRAFFPDGDFAAEPVVPDEGIKAVLVNGAAFALLRVVRPIAAFPLFARALAATDADANWQNAGVVCHNLCVSYINVGHLPGAGEYAKRGLDYADRLPATHHRKDLFTQGSHALAATAAALRGDDEGAAEHFVAALEWTPDDRLSSPGAVWRSIWLARCGESASARDAARFNAEGSRRMQWLDDQTLTLTTQAFVERSAWMADDPERQSPDQMRGYALDAVAIGRRCGDHFYLTYALLEAGRCAALRARLEADRRSEFVAEAERFLDEAEERADYAEYHLILADAHVARAELAVLAGYTDTMHEHCRAAIAICDDPTCGYAWAKQDAEALLKRHP